MTRDDENQIGAVLKGYTEGFVAANIEALLGLWASGAGTEVTYRPAESNEIMTGLQRLREYYGKLEGAYLITSGETKNIVIRGLGDLAYVLCDFDWKYALKANPDISIDFYSRASIVMRKRGNQWQYVHMHESVMWSEPT